MKEEYLKLQDSIASIDLLYEPSSNTGLIVFLVKKMEPIQIRMEPDTNHKTPHIHITLGKLHHHASYSILDGSILAGKSSRYDETIEEWISMNRDKLIELWNTAKAGKPYEYLVEVLKRP